MNRNELSLAKFQGITCQQCGQRWKPLGQRRGPAPKFCSNACRQAHYRGTDSEQYKANKNKTCNAPRPIAEKQTTADLIAECDALLARCRELRGELS